MNRRLKIVASIEARMSSSRLPGKVLMNATNELSMLEFMIQRILKSKYIDDIIVATTENIKDNPIIELCKKNNIKFFRGSEPDVLKRVLEAHRQQKTDIIVELTGDCPLIDPQIIDLAIKEYLESDVDYVSNAHLRSFPDGMDVQVFSLNILEEVNKKTNLVEDRENVSTYIYRSNEYKLKAIVAAENHFWPELRITLDDTGDLLLIREIINELYPLLGIDFTLTDIISFLKKNPKLLELNKNARTVDASFQKIITK